MHAVQDVPQLARLLLTVLVEDSLRLRLAFAARATALQFAPSVIADRCRTGLDLELHGIVMSRSSSTGFLLMCGDAVGRLAAHCEHPAAMRRLEAVLYSLTAGARELLHLRTPALADLHMACAAASLACAKPPAASQAPAASVSPLVSCVMPCMVSDSTQEYMYMACAAAALACAKPASTPQPPAASVSSSTYKVLKILGSTDKFCQQPKSFLLCYDSGHSQAAGNLHSGLAGLC